MIVVMTNEELAPKMAEAKSRGILVEPNANPQLFQTSGSGSKAMKYAVWIGDGGRSQCTCAAGQHKIGCVHVGAVHGFIRERAVFVNLPLPGFNVSEMKLGT